MNVELIYFPYGSADLSGRRTERSLFSATLSNQVWDRRAETVKSKLPWKWICFKMLWHFPLLFYKFATRNRLAALITNSLLSVPIFTRVFVEYLKCCQTGHPSTLCTDVQSLYLKYVLMLKHKHFKEQ